MGDKLQSLFQDYFAGQLRFDEPLSRHTTIRVGGPADMLLIPKNISDILQALRLAKEQNLPIKVIGKGSNLLVSDAGIRGLVLKISDTLDTLQIEGNEITIGAGHGLSKLA